MEWNIYYNLFPVLRFVSTSTHNSKTTGHIGPSTYQMTALLSKIFIFRVRAKCEIWFASYGSKHVSQSLSIKPFVNSYIHNLKTKGHIWTLCMFNSYSSIGDTPCVILKLHERSEWAFGSDTHRLFSDTTMLCVYCKHVSVHTLLFGMQLHFTTKLIYLMTAYYTPNNSFTVKNASFYKNKVG